MAWVDLDRGLFHRKPIGKAEEENKRADPVRLPARLLTHLRRWKRLGISKTYVVEHNGKPVGEVNKGFRVILTKAGLGADATPHVLRHTCATWLMQRGAAIWDAAGYLSMPPAILEKHYGHHYPDYQAGASKRATSAPPAFADIWSTHYLPAADRKIRDERRVTRKASGKTKAA
jgi:integrase